MITPPAAIDTGNWAGYEWRGGSTSAAEFVVPEFPFHDMSVAEKENHTVMSLWTGLGVAPYIEQIGVYDYVQAGHVDWATFCDFWPTYQSDCGPNHGVSTGDEIFVSVHRSGFTYKMTMRDAGPHNKWVVSISRTLNHEDTAAEAIQEDSTYPGNPFEPLTYFNPVNVNTSPSPATEVYDASAFAVKDNAHEITIRHR